ncbi:uncharacterized protein DUF1206 [Sediminihabitans luteus]|uniref:Uncharacterized protein DUF1206 n=1 Tax=Sediminihabitans luteus TaxID=1138585 RepID=A0A2M9CPZ5_9CELL|nr:DUF1206 domain-containing protein [Sediminihabitans luteus]PJJ73974.1 uncharacterized protein DUF1206 [Sediminihabitans luteus]GII98113.1 membrane protein [Sediminihabitans luteus]
MPTGSSTTPSSAARSANDSKALTTLARVGYVASGLVHLLVGWIAIKVAMGSSGKNADQSGAFQEIASTPGGVAALWAAVVGFVALAVWQVTEAIAGGRSADPKDRTMDRVKAISKAVLYGFLAWTAFRYASGGSTSGGGSKQESLTADLMGSTAGRVAIGVVGLVIVGVGVFHVVKGWRKKFLEDLRGTGGRHVGTAVVRLGQVGYIAKGIALGVLGGLFVAAAVTADPEKAGGLDDALRTIGEQPFGQFLLIATGVGIAAYGVYSFARARFARM